MSTKTAVGNQRKTSITELYYKSASLKELINTKLILFLIQ